MALPTPTFSATSGSNSSVAPHRPEDAMYDIKNALMMFDPTALLADGVTPGGIGTDNLKDDGVTADKLAHGAITDTIMGTRTADPAIAAAYALAGTMTQHISWFAKAIKALKGVAGNWWDATSATVEAIWAKFHATTGHKHSGAAGDGPIVYPPGIVNVRAYGATGDGVTDDSAAIAAAIASVPPFIGVGEEYLGYVGVGGYIYLPAGVYYITQPIVLKSFQSLVGAGRGTVIKNGATTTPAIKIEPVPGGIAAWCVQISNLTITGAAVGYTAGGYGIYGEKVYRSYIGPVWITDTADSAIRFDGASYTYIKDTVILVAHKYGIELVDTRSVDPTKYVTACWIKDSTIRYCVQAGVKLDRCLTVTVKDNTIESNGSTGEVLGEAGHQTLGIYSTNLYMRSCLYCTVENNYFEESVLYVNQLQIGIAGYSVFNLIENNFLANYLGLLLWGGDPVVGVPVYNLVKVNRFPISVNPNLRTGKLLGDTAPYCNSFVDNWGLNWDDADANYVDNIVRARGPYGVTSVSGGATYTPALRPQISVTNWGIAGVPANRIIAITLDQNIAVNAATNPQQGDMLTLMLIQDAAGGRTVTWDGAYKQTWSDAGNTANKHSSIVFYFSAGFWYQAGAQSPYYA